ncbi:hypothetical protein SAMN05421505_1702 [Sinosporangium album]|uniref:Uncharacterized protein n=1 Tax=Sinosporangium album TaxID=504805 RepID=A0A1G8LK99_9ACTN|nr:hypothetical protein [Sinosporangium album]SDI56111.1 hypothetical protein SAMN05421505_1702 [Sinosporangium album]
MAQTTASPERPLTADELAPFVDLLATWIAREGDPSRERFLAYRRTGNNPAKLAGCLMSAASDLIVADKADFAALPVIGGESYAKLTSPAAWLSRSDLFFGLLAELGRRGAVLPPRHPGDEAEEDVPRFEDLPGEQDPAGDFA